MTAIAKPKDKRFDPAKVQAMAEPFTARIEKKKGNAVMPVFQKEGLSRDDVMGIENFILTQWTGGGFYEGRLTDAQGNNMDWTFAYDPSQYPERVPPELGQAHANPVVAAAAAAGQTAVMMQAQGGNQVQQTVSAMPSVTPGTPTVSQASAVSMLPQGMTSYATPFNMGYPQMQPVQQMQMPMQVQPQQVQQVQPGFQQGYPQMVLTGVPGAPSGDDRIRALEAQLRDQLIEKKDLEFKSALAVMQQTYAQQIAALQGEIRRMGETGSSTGNAKVEELKQQIEAQKTAMLEQRLAALADAVTKAQTAAPAPSVSPEITAMMEALKAQNAETQRRLEDEKRQREADRAEERHRQELQAMQAQMQQLTLTMQQQAVQAPNPMLEAVRNMADRMMGVMVNPVQMIELMDRKGNAADGVIKTMMDMMQGIAGMYQQAVQITSSGGPSTTGVIVQEAINKIGDGIQAAAAAVRDRGVMAEKVKVEQARAQAAMANALVQRAALEPQPQAQGALNGAPVEAPPAQAQQPQMPQAPVMAPTVPVKPPAKNGSKPDRDHALLGVAYDEVMTLRKAVTEGKLDAKGAASAIYQGAGYMRSNGIEIPAFKLLENEQYADFVEALLPGLKDAFLGEVVKAFVALVENDGVEMPDEDGGDADSVSEEEPSATASGGETESETPAAT